MSRTHRELRDLLLGAAVVGSLLAAAIFGSLYWKPGRRQAAGLVLGEVGSPAVLAASAPGLTLARVAEAVRPAVVYLEGLGANGAVTAQGSGLVVHADGYLVTNWHVVRGATRIRVLLDDGRELEGKLLGHSQRNDLAVVTVSSDEPLPVGRLGDSDQVRVGEWVMAVGAPFGLASTVSAGVVGAIHRRRLGTGATIPLIVTDAAINPGNSGGPLVNLRGEVVGLNSAIPVGREGRDGPPAFAGIGYAIPVNTVREVAQALIGNSPGRAAPGDRL